MITVIIPTFNRESTIVESVMSVINQSYKDIEILIIDDGSSDKTIDIIKNVKDSRIKIYKLNSNKGACFARNYGVELAKGEFIAFQDSDDIWVPSKLELQLKYLEKLKCDIIASNYCLDMKRYEKDKDKDVEYKKVHYNDLLEENYISTQTLFGKKECFEKVKFDNDLPRLQDWDIALRLARKYSFYYLNIPLVNVNQQDNSISKNPKKLLVAGKIIYKKNKQEIEKNIKAKNNMCRILGAASRRLKVYERNYYFDIIKTKKFELTDILKAGSLFVIMLRSKYLIMRGKNHGRVR